MANPVLVGPDIEKPTHHLSLTDSSGKKVGLIAVNTNSEPDDSVIARNPVERSSLKTSTGQSQYSDLRPPYTAIVQADWSGGRASAKFENDQTKFYDNLRVNTGRTGRVILQGRETYATGFRSDLRQLPGSMKMIALVDSRQYMAIRKSATSTFNTIQIWAWVRYIGKPNSSLTFKLRADNAGEISTVLQTGTIAVTDLEPLISELRKVTITSQAISSGTPYWVEVYGDADDDEENHWEIGLKTVTGSTYQSAVGAVWADWVAATSMDLYFRLVPAPTNGDGFFFSYKNCTYFITKPNDGTASALWINGARGVATSNAANLTKLNAGGSPGWTNDEWAGGVAVVISGTGSTETQNWRLIDSNDANSLTLTEDWLITHDTTTEFVIVGVDKWTEITGHGITKPVSCVRVSSKNVIYFCQGEDAAIRRMREYNNAGTWTRQYADDGTSKAVFMEEYSESGVMNIIRSNGDTTVSKNIVSRTQNGGITSGNKVITGLTDTSKFIVGMKITGSGIGDGSTIDTIDSGTQVTGTVNSTATGTVSCTFTQGTPAWGTNLSWEAAKEVGDAWDRITNLYRYVDDNQDEAVWIMKEGGPWVWIGAATDSLDRIKLDEFKMVASSKNGKAVVKQNVYLWYSVENSIHRFYYPTLDDVGPTNDEGLPATRQGPIVSALAYPGRLFVAIDAGSSGYSTVLENTGGSSWHEVYRAPYGERIYAIGFQVIPGSTPDKMWVRQANDMVWVPFPSDTFDPYQDTNYTYCHEGVLTLASMYAGLMDAWKNWHAIKTHAESLVEDTTWLEADYRLDDEDDWHPFPDKFEEIPISTVEFGNEFGGSSKKLDLRIRFYSIDQTKTPKLLAVILEAVVVSAPKFAFSFPVHIGVADLLGEKQVLQPYQQVQILDTWSGTAQPLKMNSNNPLYDNLQVFLQPLPSKQTAIIRRDSTCEYIISVIIQEA